jgi:hypothetical protein
MRIKVGTEMSRDAGAATLIAGRGLEIDLRPAPSEENVDPQITFSPTLPSFTRVFGPDTATPIPASTWTRIPLIGPWKQFGANCWQLIVDGDPDYANWGGCVRCLREGIYDFGGGIIFDPAQQTGDRAVSIIEAVGPNAGQWELIQSASMPTFVGGGFCVGGNVYQYVGNIVSLRVYSTVATTTTASPLSEWASMTFLGYP